MLLLMMVMVVVVMLTMIAPRGTLKTSAMPSLVLLSQGKGTVLVRLVMFILLLWYGYNNRSCGSGSL